MKKARKPDQEKLEKMVGELEEEINTLQGEVDRMELELLDKRENLFMLRTLLPGVCPWCGETGCEEKDGECTEGLD